MENRKEFHTLPIELLWERGIVCTPAYGGLLCSNLEEATTLYFSYETGEATPIPGEQIEALT